MSVSRRCIPMSISRRCILTNLVGSQYFPHDGSLNRNLVHETTLNSFRFKNTHGLPVKDAEVYNHGSTNINGNTFRESVMPAKPNSPYHQPLKCCFLIQVYLLSTVTKAQFQRSVIQLGLSLAVQLGCHSDVVQVSAFCGEMSGIYSKTCIYRGW